jgi:hypothetical protein
MNFSEHKQISKFGRKKVQSDAGSILAHDLVLGAFWPTHAVGETGRLGRHGAQLAWPACAPGTARVHVHCTVTAPGAGAAAA